MCYLLEDTCFTGDVGGVRLQKIDAVRLPSVPPEYDPILWQQSIEKLKNETIDAVAPTHFGVHGDADWHLGELQNSLNEITAWMEEFMPSDPSRQNLRQAYASLIERKTTHLDLSDIQVRAFESAISSHMSADGIYRYWNKYRSNR
jgi:hypothetical protein